MKIAPGEGSGPRGHKPTGRAPSLTLVERRRRRVTSSRTPPAGETTSAISRGAAGRPPGTALAARRDTGVGPRPT